MTARKKSIRFFLAFCLLVGAALTARAAQASWAVDPPVIGWWVLSAGGGLSSSSTVSLNATLGQPMVGTSSNGALMLNAGYWNGLLGSGTMGYLPILRK
jgi:hypothetical protein